MITAEGNLAILLEYDAAGRRYSEGAHLRDAVAEYQKVGQDKLRDLDIPNNLAYALFYSGDSAGALKAAQTLNPQPIALMAASHAVLESSKEGLSQINKLTNNDAAFKETARTAGEMLMNTRHYALAADFLQAGASGDNAAQTMGLASLLRDAKRHEDLQFANTPGRPCEASLSAYDGSRRRLWQRWRRSRAGMECGCIRAEEDPMS